MKVLVVRAAEDASRTIARLAAAGHEAIVSSVIVVRPTSVELPGGQFDAAVATSGHAFVDPRRLQRLIGVPLFVVGARTAEAARVAGWPAPKRIAPNALDLADQIRQSLPSGSRAIYLAGRDRRPDLEQALASSHDLRVVEVYAADEAEIFSKEAATALSDGSVDAVLHYSRRSAEIFLRLITRAALESAVGHTRHIAISADAAAPLIAAKLRVDIARAPNEDAMFAALSGPAGATA